MFYNIENLNLLSSDENVSIYNIMCSSFSLHIFYIASYHMHDGKEPFVGCTKTAGCLALTNPWIEHSSSGLKLQGAFVRKNRILRIPFKLEISQL